MHLLQMDHEELRPLIRQIAAELLTQFEAGRARIDSDRIAWSEAEAASMLGLLQHQLRDERRRGRITCSVGPGRRVLYSRADLLRYLESRRWAPTE